MMVIMLMMMVMMMLMIFSVDDADDSVLTKTGSGGRPFRFFAEGCLPSRTVSGGRPFKSLAEGCRPEGRGRGVVRLNLLPKAVNLDCSVSSV